MIMTNKDAADFYDQIEKIKKGQEIKTYIPIEDRKTSCMRCKDKRYIYV